MLSYNTLLQEISKAISVFDRKIGTKNSGDYSDLIVVFEFECYLNLGEFEYSSSENHETLDPDTIDIDDWFDIIANYFSNNVRRLRNFENRFEEWKIDKIEEAVQDEWINTSKDGEINDELGYRWDALSEEEQNQYSDFDDFANQFRDDIETEEKDRLREYLADHLDLAYSDYFSDNFLSFREVIHQFNLEPDYGWSSFNPDVFNISDEIIDDDDVKFNEKISELYPQLADDIKYYFPGSQVTVSTEYHGKYKLPTHWSVEPDGSLNQDGPDESGVLTPVEIVTPWTSGDDALSLLHQFKDFFKDHDGETNETTGCHINIRFAENVDIDWLKLLIIAQDVKDLKKFSRENSHYAKGIFNELIDRHHSRIFDSSELSPELLEDFKEFLTSVYKPQKMDAINLVKFMNDLDPETKTETHRQGFVEFRIVGGDYLEEHYTQTIDALMKYMNLMHAAIAGSTDFNDEYHFKLYRLFNMMLEFHKIAKSEPKSSLAMKDIILLLSSLYNVKKCMDELENFLKTDYYMSASPIHLKRKIPFFNHYISRNGRDPYIWLLLLFYLMNQHSKDVKFSDMFQHIQSILNYLKQRFSDQLTTEQLTKNIEVFKTIFPKMKNVDLFQLTGLKNL